MVLSGLRVCKVEEPIETGRFRAISTRFRAHTFDRKPRGALAVFLCMSPAGGYILPASRMNESRLGPAALGDLTEESLVVRPLCVDLDGTLVRTDTLWESVLILVRRRPWFLILLPFWVLRGRAGFKRAVAERVSLDPASLPYRSELIDILRASAAKGRRLVLSTAADVRVAELIAEHLDLFDEVIASNGRENLKAARKRDSLAARFAPTGFDYVGDAAADLPVLAAAHRGFLVGASPATARRARLLGAKVQVLSTRASLPRALLRVLRVHQWTKNALVIVPVVLAEHLPSPRVLVQAALAALSFSLCASAGYVFNDLVDVAADRAHATKKMRPFASGDLPVVFGIPLFAGLLALSFGIAFSTLTLPFVGMLAVYLAATLAYSFYLKSKLMVDVVVLAWLYTHRVLAGGIAAGIPISAWLLAFSMFVFSSLAFCKRYIELQQVVGRGVQINSRGYYTQDLEMVASMGPTAGYMAVLVFCLYVESSAVTVGYRHPGLLWFVCPVLLYWISRIWFLAHRGQVQDDPVKFAITDRKSWMCALALAAVAAVARFWPR
jgi:4-hydroxybenzoate polyprenyltransferase